MAEGINVRVSGKLRKFIEQQTGPNGLYESSSEYIRTLIRQDYARQEKQKWNGLFEQLEPGMEADESEFISFDPNDIIRTANNESG